MTPAISSSPASAALRRSIPAELTNFDMRAYAAGSGGALTIETSSPVQLGGERPADPSVMYISGSLYSERGFRSVSITGDVTIPDGAVLNQLPVGIDLGANYMAYGTGTKITDIGTIGVLRPEVRARGKAGGLTLSSLDNIEIGRDVVIRTDTRGAINITAMGDVTVGGTLEATAGQIRLAAADTLRVLDGAKLLARGAAITAYGSNGLRNDIILSGGTVSLQDQIQGSFQQNLVMDAGSLIDVSGTSGMVEVATGGLSGRSVTRLDVHGDGGAISLGVGLNGSGKIAGALVGHSGGAARRAAACRSAISSGDIALTNDGRAAGSFVVIGAVNCCGRFRQRLTAHWRQSRTG